MDDLTFLASVRKYPDPTLSEVQHLLKLIRDMYHVDEVADFVMRQDAEWRGDLLRELQAKAAEEQYGDRQRDGYPSSAEYAADYIRKAGRGHLLKDA